ncbi:NAD(P)/FAD-dependent oxidoreductase [Longimicrobium sp.]|uniref:flavin monoamine oxidase family protein n=1 Tax=Longimicrobium sp. TaxID=2029185 RepID=UPI002E36F741|nr:NAD(P)/FAD-dependent oxidoreductase [Longimicrobium sp.]HEX6039798.1 NAD(P)/FAD-dependent oxidoreductase [Longimicrobium sp.]
MNAPPPTRADASAAKTEPSAGGGITRREFIGLAVPMAVAACTPPGQRRRAAEGRTRVVVIGAGLAGLAAALELVREGVEVRVLEARGRPGGRVHTLRDPFDDGLYAEAGAVFVPGDHATTQRFAREYGVALQPVAEDGRGRASRVFVAGQSIRLGTGETPRWPVPLKPREASLTPGELRSLYLDPVVSAIGDPEHPLWPGDAALRFDGMTMEQLLLRRGASPGAIGLMRLGYLDEWGDGIGAISALALLRDLAVNRGGGTYRVEGGTDRLPAAMAARLGDAVRYDAPVTAIEVRRNRPRVEYRANGRTRRIVAEHVICAIPFTVLRGLRMDPQLPGPQRAAVTQLPATSVTRVYLQMRERVWNPDEGTAVATDLPIRLTAQASAGQPGGREVIEAFVTGAHARALARLPADECVRRVREQVARIVPGAEAAVERAAVYAWDLDPWARGDYAWFRPGQLRTFLPHLAAPAGRIHFAGDQTSARPGWMQGALDSGIRAAREVMDALGSGRRARAQRPSAGAAT